MQQLKEMLVKGSNNQLKLYTAVGISAGFGLLWFKKWLAGGVCHSQTRIDGKSVVITGGNTGIGYETALELAKRGGKIIIACRDIIKGEKARKSILELASVPEDRVRLISLDLASLESVRKVAKEILDTEPRIDYLINNAGVAAMPKTKTQDGFEMQIGTNHLGHFLLTNLLLDRIKESAPARIINVSSMAHISGKIDPYDLNYDRREYNSFKAYMQSKLANILFTKELAKRLEGSGVTVYTLHPGAVQTELGRYLTPMVSWGFYLFGLAFFKTPKQGAQTTLYCVLEPGLETESGLYYRDCHVEKPAPQALDAEMAESLWRVSERLVGMKKD